MVAVLRKIEGGLCVIERIVSRSLDAPAKFAPALNVRKAMHGTEEASNGGKVKVRIIHGLNISQKNSYTYCKSLLALSAKYYYAFS